MSDLREDVSVLYKGRKGSVDFIDVPSLLFALVPGQGDPEAAEFADARVMVQPEPIDEALLEQAREQSRGRELPALDCLCFERWEEGRCAQTLHVGPYADDAGTIAVLDEAITAAGLKVHGKHHEIYLGAPRRSAPEKLRTLICHPLA